MKKILLLIILLLTIPFFIVTIFITEEKKTNNQKIEIKNERKIRVKRNNDVVEIPFEEYIVGVVAAEMPAKFENEALKAQAVAARTYVLKKIEQNKTNEYDVTDDIMNQVYIDENQMKQKWGKEYDIYLKKINDCVNATKGEYLTYNDEVIEAFFFSSSSGKTENSEDVFTESLPYLRSVDSSWDSEVVPVFSETNTFTLQEFYDSLGLKFNEKLDIETIEKTSTGKSKILKINDQIMKATDIRKKLNLKSTDFTINISKNYINITTKGSGHDVGMSQYGANAMSLKGYTYDKILKYYYQGVKISKMQV